MEVFLTVLLKLIPFYFIIFLGFLGGRYLHINKESIANLLLYIIGPFVIFNGIFTTNLTLATLSIPFLFFILCVIVSLITYYFSGFLWKDSTRNILAFSAGSGNTGFFGLPVAVALFGTYTVGLAGLVILGAALFTNTIGFFLAAKGQYSTKESLLKILKLPLIYAFFFGVLANLSGILLPEILFSMTENFNTVFSILGMMLIGIAIAEITKLHIDFKYTSMSLFARFFLWPAIMLIVIFLDSHVFKFFDSELYAFFLFMSIVPVAATRVSYATILKSHPDKVSLDVLISTLFALFFIPLVAYFF